MGCSASAGVCGQWSTRVVLNYNTIIIHGRPYDTVVCGAFVNKTGRDDHDICLPRYIVEGYDHRQQTALSVLV